MTESVAEALARGTRHHQAGELAQAEMIYRQVLDADPDHAAAMHQLGVVAIQQYQLELAVQLITRAIVLDVNQALFHVNLGDAQRRLGNILEAIRCNQQAAALEPQWPGPLTNLGLLYQEQGDFNHAAECFRRVVAFAPSDAPALSQLGRALLLGEQFEEAETCFRAARQAAPQDARTHYNLGAVLQAGGKLDEAAACYRAALTLRPDSAETHNNLGAVLNKINAFAEAEKHYRQAIRIDPTFAKAYCNLGSVLSEVGSHDEAILHCRRAIDLNPNYAEAYGNMAEPLAQVGRFKDAIAAYRRAVELDSTLSSVHSSLLFALNYDPAQDPAGLFAEHRAWGVRHADPLTVQAPPHANQRAPKKRLRVGYVSPNFFQQAVSFFSEPILASHDHSTFEVCCYSDVARPDETTVRMRGYADCWRDTFGQTDAQLAQTIRDDEIDILVDLTGHIASGNRLLMFARKPAPVQVTYLGYQNTTGMLAMDYRLTDAYADPPDTTDAFYTEELVRLPRSFFCYRPTPNAPTINSLPARENGHITFGSFNNFAKITPEVIATWAQMLQEVPGARLVLMAHVTDSLRNHVSSAFEYHGVRAERLELASRRPLDQYLALISSVDIALDPFPFVGHTTTCDCLWQGVPVVTLAGKSYASRFGGTALLNLGLQDLIAQSREEYVEIAARLASDLDRLEQLRAGLRNQMLHSPLLDAQGFTRNLEAAYRQMWVRWCQPSSGNMTK